MKNLVFEMWIGGGGRLVEISFTRETVYRQLGECWSRLKSERTSLDFLKMGKSERADSLHVEFDADVNYIEGKHDHTARLITLRVADDWLQDVIGLWHTVKPNDDKYSNHQYFLRGKKTKLRGSTRRGYSLQVEHNIHTSGLDLLYELRGPMPQDERKLD